MNRITARFLCKWMHKQFALHGISCNDACPHDVEVFARGFIIPRCASRRQCLQAHWSARRMARHAARVLWPLGREDGLHLRFKKFKIERWRRRRRLLHQHCSRDRNQSEEWHDCIPLVRYFTSILTVSIMARRLYQQLRLCPTNREVDPEFPTYPIRWAKSQC